MNNTHSLLLLTLFIIFLPSAVLAGEGVTLVFKSGQVVSINDGYRAVVSAMRSLDKKSTEVNKIVELSVGGSTFLLNMAEVVIVCRDECSNLQVNHQLDPARSKSRQGQ